MTTVEERREVARRLRECRGGWSSGECYYTIIHALGLSDTSREDGGAALYAHLADLIEPELERTCEDVSTEHGKFECSYCGCKITDTRCVDNGLVRFCPDCGRWVENAY